MTLPKSFNGDLINHQLEKFICMELNLGVAVTLNPSKGTHLSTHPLSTSLPAWRGLDWNRLLSLDVLKDSLCLPAW